MTTDSAAILSAAPPVSRPGEPAWEVAYLFPPQGGWSEAEYLALDTNRLVELRDGFLEVLPMPTIFHQLIVKFLHAHLDAYIASLGTGSGLVLFAPLPVRLGSGRFREPDVVYLRPARIPDDRRRQPQGADLVMEVLSEGEENRHRDLDIKRGEYALAGIQEYWTIDPELRQITVLSLAGTVYREHGVFGSGTTAVSALLPNFALAVDDVLAAGEAA